MQFHLIEEAQNFIQNHQITRQQIQENISWNGKKFPQRSLFVKIKKYVRDFLKGNTMEPRMVGIAGIRGVGKTTLLWQIGNFVKNHFKEVKVYFLSMDIASSYGFDVRVLIEALEKIIGSERSVVLLLDEVQYMEQWTLMLKIIYDKFKNAFVMATGSASLLLHSNTDLSTRWNVESLYPLSFTEFIMIKSWLKSEGEKVLFPEKGLSSSIREVLFFSKEAKAITARLQCINDEVQTYFKNIETYLKLRSWQSLLKEYIFYHNIPRFLLLEEKRTIISRAFDLLNRVLYQDLKEFYEQNEVMKIQRLLIRIALSDEINKEKLSQFLGIKVGKVDRIIDSLAKAELIMKFPAYGGSKTRLKQTKLFFTSPTMRYAIIKQLYANPKVFYPRLYEDIVALYLRRLFNGLVLYGGKVGDKSPDFIVEIDGQVLPIEVGTGKRDLAQLEAVRDKKYGLLVSFSSREVRVWGSNVVVPLRWFLLV